MELLLVEANGPLARSLRTGLEEEGFSVHAVRDLHEAQVVLSCRQFAAIIVDISPNQAEAVLQTWRRAAITAPVLVLSAPGCPLENLNGVGLGPGAFLAKPFGFDALLNELGMLTRNHSSLAPKESGNDLDASL
jgi:DNA-binding response OmpR family regulator